MVENPEWSSGQPQDITSRRPATRQFACAHETVVNVASDFQIAPKNTGVERSIISVGQVCDRGNIISSLAIELSSNVLVVCIG